MSKPIKNYKFGKIQGAVWQGDYKGKPTYSMTFQKSYKSGNDWKHTNYFSNTDLRDLYILVGSILNNQVKCDKQQDVKQQVKKEFQGKEVENDLGWDVGTEQTDGEIPF